MPLRHAYAPDQIDFKLLPAPQQTPEKASPLPVTHSFPTLFSQDSINPDQARAEALKPEVDKAIQQWDMEKLVELMHAGADVHQAGPAAMKMAAQENHLSQVLELIALLKQSGVDLNTIDQHGDTALSAAAREGHHEVVSALTAALLQTGGDINSGGRNGFTPLSEAAYKGHRAAVAVLIDALQQSGGTLNPANEYGFTPLTRAAYMGHWEVVYLLADALKASGDDVNVVTPGCGSALSLAIEDQHLEAADRLMQSGAHPSEEDFQDLAHLMGFANQRVDKAQLLSRAREMRLQGVVSVLE